jgi:hypothetical protein
MFLVGNSYDAGAEEETRQGIIAAEAAKAAGVGHLIYSSSACFAGPCAAKSFLTLLQPSAAGEKRTIGEIIGRSRPSGRFST